MSSYGNPDRKNKYERDASDMIHKVESAITSWLKEGGHFPGGPGIKVDSQLYYDDAGQPSRFLEMYFGRAHSSVRVAVQRNITGHPWTCYWVLFTNGKSQEEGQFDSRGISQIGPELTKKILARWEYAF